MVQHIVGENIKRLWFSKLSIQTTLSRWRDSYGFKVRNGTILEPIEVPLEIDQATFWETCFSVKKKNYFPVKKKNVITNFFSQFKPIHFHSSKRFINDLCTKHDVVDFGRSTCDIYPKCLQPKVLKWIIW